MKSVSLLKDSKPEYLIPDAAIRASPKLAPTVMAGVPVSYTHLDVYKRQAVSDFAWRPPFFAPALC